jgi:hypothetical protein
MMSKRNNGIPNVFTRREFSGRLATFLSAVGIAGTAFAATGSRDAAGSAGGEEISHAAESIHQETVLIASRKRVYEALTETKRFDKIIELTGVMKSMPPGGTQRRIFA